jgi:hypothetical protein
MRSHRFHFKGTLLLAALGMMALSSGPAQAQRARQGRQPGTNQLAPVLQNLVQAQKLLRSAEVNDGGHHIHALKEIRQAMQVLSPGHAGQNRPKQLAQQGQQGQQGSAGQRQTQQTTPTAQSYTAAADQLRQARSYLETAISQLNGMTRYPRAAQAVLPLQNAVQDINQALTKVQQKQQSLQTAAQ